MSDVRTKKETEPGQVGSKLLTRADLQAVILKMGRQHDIIHSGRLRVGGDLTLHYMATEETLEH